MKILVTGGRGFIGSHIIDELAKGQDEIFCLTRTPAAPHRWGDRVKMVAGNVTDEVSLKAATRGMDCVVHCVQFPNHPVENRRKGHTYINIDGMGTARLVWTCVDNGVKRFVYLSGAGTSPVKTQPWFQAKVMAEERIRLSGMQYVILRPSWVYGPEDRSLNKFVTFVRYLPVVPVIGSGKSRVQPVSVFDVAAVAAAAVHKAEATGKVFELGGPEILTMDEIIRTVMRVLGKRRFLFHQPALIMKLVALPMTLLPTPPLSPAAIDFILMEELVDPSEAIRVFGITFERLEDGLRRYLKP